MRCFTKSAALAALLVAGPASAETLNVMCPGTVSVDSTGLFSGAFGSGQGERRVQFDDSLDVRIRDGVGEARVPRKLKPMVSDGGSDGWFPLINLSVSSTEIYAAVRMNANYKPKIRIDRVTGRITLQGALGDFSGSCSAYDPDKDRPKF